MKELMERVYEANMELWKRGLVIYTWGNVSEIDRAKGLVAIKPSGVPYERLAAEDIVVLELGSGKPVAGTLKPSSDMPTHLALYRAFPTIGGIAHAHSRNATAWAQAGLSLPCYGTTHADYFYQNVPCTRGLTDGEIAGAYEEETGAVIVEAFEGRDPMSAPAVLVKNHGPFTWGENGMKAVENAVVLEEVSAMAQLTRSINPEAKHAPETLMNRHYFRKHGKGAYYGQK